MNPALLRRRRGSALGGISVPFGAETLTGPTMGRAAPAGATSIASGGEGWIMALGPRGQVVYPAVAGVIPTPEITFNGSSEVWRPQPEPNVLSCGDGGLGEIIALGTAALDGKSIKAHPDADMIGINDRDSLSFTAMLNFTLGLSVTSHATAAADYGKLRRCFFGHNGRIAFDRVDFRDRFVQTLDITGIQGIIDFSDAGAGQSELVLDNCEFYSTDKVADHDWTQGASGTAAAHTGGVSTTTVTLTNSPDLAAVEAAGAGTYSVLIGGGVYRIDAASDAGNTLTIDRAITIDAGTPANYSIGFTPKFLYGIRQLGSGTNKPKLTVRHCKLRDLDRGITGLFNELEIRQTYATDHYGDFRSLHVDGTEAKLEIVDNVCFQVVNRPATPLDPHLDGDQINLGQMVQANTTPYVCRGNCYFITDGQLWFFENWPDPTHIGVTVDIAHNLGIGGQRNGITLEDGSAAARVRWNTLAFDTSGDSTFDPFAIVQDEQAGSLFSDNIWHGISYQNAPLTQARTINNTEHGGITDGDIGTNLRGPTFDLTTFANWREARDAVLVLPGSPSDLADPKRGAGHFYSYEATPAPAGSRSGVGAGVASEPADAVPNTWATADFTVATSGTAQAIDIDLTAFPAANSDAISDVEYDIDGSGTPISMQTTTPGVVTALMPTPGTVHAIRVRAVNRQGPGAWSASKSATSNATPGGYVTTGTTFTSSTDFMADASLSTNGPAASKKGIVSLWALMDPVLPTSGGYMTLQGGGTNRCSFNHASSKRITLFHQLFAGGSLTTAPNALDGLEGTWVHFLIDWDTTAGEEKANLWINGVKYSDAVSATDATMTQITRVGFPWISAISGDKHMAEIYVNLSETLDFDVAENMEKLRKNGKPVDLGADGSAVTGTAPSLGYWKNPFGTFNVDVSGNGNTLPVTGELSAAPSSPTD